MSFNNPAMPWGELERALSGRGRPPTVGDGNDAPAWSRKRDGYQPPVGLRSRRTDGDSSAPRVPYAELHCHSNFSFLDGASHPEELVEEAARLGLDAVALTDHDGMYGVVRFAEAAREIGIRTIYGAELSLGLAGPQNGVADPEGQHLLLLARNPEGYRRLCRVISAAQLRGGEKGRPVYDWDEVVAETAAHCLVLTGCRKSSVRRALVSGGPAAGADALAGLVAAFGSEGVAVELTDHGYPLDTNRNDLLAGLALDARLPVVATNAVHYARPGRGRLATAMAAVRARRSLDDMAGWLPPAPTAYLRSGTEMRDRFRRYPGAVQGAAALGVECSFDLRLLAPSLPPFPVPPGHDENSYLRELVADGARRRYGSRADDPAAYRQLDHELGIIERLSFPGYFLVVWDIVRFCREHDILCQGRGSAANSAVCYALGITNADPVRWGLLFERFLAPERDGPPDIDVDIESDRREEAIQYVYRLHGRRHAAQVANVITYRPRSAIRDAAKALGFSPGQQDAWSKHIDGWQPLRAHSSGEIPDSVVDLAVQFEGAPRHLGIHSGGMVIADRPVSEIVPIEWARMADRSILQWDKDDCAAIGLVKFDLLGLGMLSAIHYTLDLVRDHEGVDLDLARLDLADPAVYDMLCAADAVGVFQVESRAQLATLPRLRPRKFYDLVVEVALIRPGPIQGGSVHPYLRRRAGERWEHAHPLLARSLDRTLGVPLFQEQVMQMAVDVAGFTASEADLLRRAMGAKRSTRKMDRLRDRFFAGAEANGVTGELALHIFEQVRAFSGYGFPEAHSMSFALLVYASAFLKHYHPAAFCAGLLRAQPMGFYSPQSLVADARRHGVTVRGPDLAASLGHATLEPAPDSTGGQAVRLGLAAVRGVGEELAERIVTERAAHGIFVDLTDLGRRVRLTVPQLETLATAGAFDSLGVNRREALWQAGAAAGERPDRLPGTTVVGAAPALPGMSAWELTAADLWATGISPDTHPVRYLREYLDQVGALPTAKVTEVADGTRILVGGAVTHRQRPATAGGITFLNLEDETGMLNVLCSPGLWARFRTVAVVSPALLVRGVVQAAENVVTLVADHLAGLDLRTVHRSRDFR
ncbi:MAG TPA: error-prone DNA polymerase [Pseudonocardiaceae bacterium]|nr:error-prone DNA polymerase [Pseudonocardiaceae bacterium]